MGYAADAPRWRLFDTALCWLVCRCLWKPSEASPHYPSERSEPSPQRYARRLADADWEPIRIAVYTEKLESDLASLGEATKNYIKDDVIGAAVSYLEATLRVKRVSGNLLLSHFCPSYWTGHGKCAAAYTEPETCGSNPAIEMPSSHFEDFVYYPGSASGSAVTIAGGTGIPNADFVLYAAAVQAGSCGSSGSGTVAYAGACQRDQNDRPIAGHMNICPEMIASQSWHEFVATVVHEVTHALVFSGGSFQKFRKADGSPLPYEEVVLQVAERGRTRTKIITPEVLESVRKRFNCPTLNGAEIEDEGGSGTAGSHWERRIFTYDIMVGMNGNSMSDLTLALFDDSGWYTSDRQAAEQHHAGRLAPDGCAFASDRCLDDGANTDPNHYCSEAGYGCDASGHMKSRCTVASYGSALPEYWQHLDDPTRGGVQADLTDFCPVFDKITINGAPPRCSDPSGEGGSSYGEVYGVSSRCIKATTISKAYVERSSFGGTCYTMRCVGGSDGYTALVVTIGAEELTCGVNDEGTEKVVGGDYPGRIMCPPVAKICYGDAPLLCANLGTSLAGRCVCPPGFIGADCATKATAVNRAASPFGLSYRGSSFALRVGEAASIAAPTWFGAQAVTFSSSPTLPQGLTLNTATGGIGGTPTNPTAGAEPFTIAATAGGDEARYVLNLNVEGEDTLPPRLVSSAPAADAEVPRDLRSYSFVLTYDERVAVGSGCATLSAGGSLVAAVDASETTVAGTTLTLQWGVVLDAGVVYTVTIPAGFAVDASANANPSVTESTFSVSPSSSALGPGEISCAQTAATLTPTPLVGELRRQRCQLSDCIGHKVSGCSTANLYTDDSSICAAAQQMGLVGAEADVCVMFVAGRQGCCSGCYCGGTANGVSSDSVSEHSGLSFRVLPLDRCPCPGKAPVQRLCDGSTPALMDEYGSRGAASYTSSLEASGSCPSGSDSGTCSNGVKDGAEEGTDCGGCCSEPCGVLANENCNCKLAWEAPNDASITCPASSGGCCPSPFGGFPDYFCVLVHQGRDGCSDWYRTFTYGSWTDVRYQACTCVDDCGFVKHDGLCDDGSVGSASSMCSGSLDADRSDCLGSTSVPSYSCLGTVAATPSAEPTPSPTFSPTNAPTVVPTDVPSVPPVSVPPVTPTDAPTVGPTDAPSAEPTQSPTSSPADAPTGVPTDMPTVPPGTPTDAPTVGPTDEPTPSPTSSPTDTPTVGPIDVPTVVPTVVPTTVPSLGPTAAPLSGPTLSPSTAVEKVVFTLTVQNVDHDKLTSNATLMESFIYELRVTIAYQAGPGILWIHVSVALRPGSVAVDAEIVPPPDSNDTSTTAVQASLNVDSLADAVTTKVAALEGIDAVTTGPVSVVDVTPIVVLMEVRTQPKKLSTSHGHIVVVHNVLAHGLPLVILLLRR